MSSSESNGYCLSVALIYDPVSLKLIGALADSRLIHFNDPEARKEKEILSV